MPFDGNDDDEAAKKEAKRVRHRKSNCKLWANNPEYRARRREQTNQRNRERWANDLDYRSRKNELRRIRRAKDPEYRAKHAAEERERLVNDPEYRARQAKRKHDQWVNDPCFRVRHLEKRRNKRALLASRPRPEKCENVLCSNVKVYYDHCHATGRFRAWLCNGCNTGLGLLSDEPAKLRGLADLIEREQKRVDEEHAVRLKAIAEEETFFDPIE